MPSWFPWIVVGGLLFTLLGFIGSKYKEKAYRPIQSLQDFISGSILVAFTGVLVPDLFPAMELPSALWTAAGEGNGDSSGKGGYSDDVHLQVGPPRLIRG